MPSSEEGRPLWDDADASLLSPLDGDASTDVCVIGLGGSGLTCVNELRRIGVEAVGLEARRVGAGAAGRNGGFLLAGLAPFYHEAIERYGHDRAVAMYRLTLEELDRIQAAAPDLVSRPGSLRIAESDDELDDCRLQLDAMHHDGLAAEEYRGPEGEGLLIPGDGTFHPLARCRALARAATSHGAALHEQSRVTSMEPATRGRLTVHTERGSVSCRAAVIAVDGALDRLVPSLAGRVRAARLQMLATAPTTEVHLTRPVYARWGYDYWQQRPDGAIAMGGGRDLGGDAEWTHDTAPSEAVQAALEQRLRCRLGVQAPITHRWAASVSYTEDGLPIVEEVQPNVWAIGAYSGTGNVIGALLGRGVARWLGQRDDELIRPFRGVT